MRINVLLLALTLAACSDKFDEGTTNDLNSASGDDGSDGTDGTGGTDGTEGPVDLDGDGFTDDVDCDDTDSDVFPGADEYCNGEDDDCDGEIDDQADLAEGQGVERHEDADGDGYGNPYVVQAACEGSSGWVDNDEDCDDEHASANPDGVEENWNGIDEDCDGTDFSLQTCLDQAVAQVASDFQIASPHAMTDFNGTYDFSFTEPLFGTTQTIPAAGVGNVTNQVAFIVDRGSSIYQDSGLTYTANFEATLGYNDTNSPFTVQVGLNPTYYTYSIFGYSLGDLVADVLSFVYTVPEDFDGTVTCLGYVDPLNSDFDGSAVISINETTESVTADVTLESTIVNLTEGDVTLTSESGGQCANDIADTLFGYIGFGSTYTFLNENLEAVGAELVAEYALALEAEIAEQCGG